MKKTILLFLFQFIVTIIIAQHFPVAVNDTAFTIQQDTITINILQNDYDIDGDSLFISCVNGSSTISDSSIIYISRNSPDTLFIEYEICKTPLSNYCGTAYLVVIINENPLLPIANPDYVEIMQFDTIVIPVLENDTDPMNNPIKIHTVDFIGGNYQLGYYTDSTVIFSPGFRTTDKTISYQVIQINGDGYYSKPTDILVEITPNPLFPVSVNDTIYGFEKTSFTVFPLENDLPPVGEEIILEQSSSSLVIEQTDTSFTFYFHEAPSNYPRTFGYKSLLTSNPNIYSQTGRIVMYIEEHPDIPIAVKDTFYTMVQSPLTINPLKNDYDPNNVPLMIDTANNIYFGQILSDSLIKVNPFTSAGTTTAYYDIIQKESPILHNAESRITFLIDENPDLPIAINDTVNTYPGIPVEIMVLKNDFDPNGKTFKIASLESSNYWLDSLLFNDSVITLFPNQYAEYINNLTYNIIHSDSLYFSEMAQIVVNHSPYINTVFPVAGNDTVNFLRSGGEAEINVLLNDFDPIGDSLTFTPYPYNYFILEKIGDSNLHIIYNGREDYPATNHHKISYKVCKKNNDAFYDYGYVLVKLYEGADWPQANPDYIETTAGIPITISPLENDYNPEGYRLTLNGKKSKQANIMYNDSTFIYTPNLHYSGIDTIYYSCSEYNSYQYDVGEIYVKVNKSGAFAILNTNNLSAGFNSFGYNFYLTRSWKFLNTDTIPRFEAPGGSGKSTISGNSLWLGAVDENENLHLAALRHSFRSTNYSPGPVQKEYGTTAYNLKWNRIYRMKKSNIEFHRQNWTSLNYLTDSIISGWPATEDIINNDVATYAPFEDINSNGRYEPEKGEYPKIKGDEALFFIFNDDRSNFQEKDGRKFGVEVQTMPYAFNCEKDSAFNNTIFINYKIINRSDTTYFDTYIGNWLNFKIGYVGDDFMGCDTTLDLFYGYNRDNEDFSIDFDISNYGYNPPATGVVWLNRKMDYFNYYNHYTLIDYDWNSARYYYFMQAYRSNPDNHLTYGWHGYSSGKETNYAFSGDPETGTGWIGANSYLNYNTAPAVVASAGPITFYPGDTIELDFAYIFARDYDGDNLSSVTLLKERATKIKDYYQLQKSPCGTPWETESKELIPRNELKVFPNPSINEVVILYDGASGVAIIELYDMLGRRVKSAYLNKDIKHTLSVTDLRDGVYLIQVKDTGTVSTAKLIKHSR